MDSLITEERGDRSTSRQLFRRNRVNAPPMGEYLLDSRLDEVGVVGGEIDWFPFENYDRLLQRVELSEKHCIPSEKESIDPAGKGRWEDDTDPIGSQPGI